MNGLLLPAVDDAVIVSVASWEIECCAPPPVVGHMTTWSLSLFPVQEPERHWLPPAVTALDWQVESWPTPDGPHRMLIRGGIVALMSTPESTAPAGVPELPDPGRRRIRGVLEASKHGGRGAVWDTFPHTTALVGSVRVITVTDWAVDEHGHRSPTQRGYSLTSCTRSPTSFTRQQGERGGPTAEQTGLLIRLR